MPNPKNENYQLSQLASGSADMTAVTDWNAYWQSSLPLRIPTRQSDEIYRMYTTQMTDVFRHGQVSGPWTVSSTARQPHYCRTQCHCGQPGHQGEVGNTFDAFYSDVFLNDFHNVDTSQYNLGGGYRAPLVIGHQNHQQMLSFTSAAAINRPVRPVCPNTPGMNLTWTYTDPVHQSYLVNTQSAGHLFNINTENRNIQTPGEERQTGSTSSPTVEGIQSEKDRCDGGDGQHSELLKLLLNDDYVRIPPTMDCTDDRSHEVLEEDQKLCPERDLESDVESKDDVWKLLHTAETEHIKEEFQEHKKMWNKEQSQETWGEVNIGLKNCSEKDENCHPDTQRRGHSSPAYQCHNGQIAFISEDISPLSPTGNKRIIPPSTDFENKCSKAEAVASGFTLENSIFTRIQDRPRNIVTSSDDKCSSSLLPKTEGTSTSSEVTPYPSDITSSHDVTSTTISEVNNKRKGRDVGRASDEPRRPKNGFIRFSIEHRNKIAALHPKMDNREISRILGCKWRKLTAEAKKCYEEAFEKDIQSIREEHPEWRYAPAKRLCEDLVEPMPSRLRPRSSLKRKHPYFNFIKTYKSRQSKKNRKKEPPSPPPERDASLASTWVQCDLCGKWRCVPVCAPQDELRAVWFCYCNPDQRYNSCTVTEEDVKPLVSPPAADSVPSSPSPSLPSSASTSNSSSSYSTYSNSNAHVLFREPSW